MIVHETWVPQQAYALANKKKFFWFCGGRACGKCLDPNTEVRMYDGSIKLAKDIKEGDFLLSVAGDTRLPLNDSSKASVDTYGRSMVQVLGITTGQEDMYRVKPINGDGFVCNESHILTVVNKHTGVVEDMPLKLFLRLPTMLDDYLYWCADPEYPSLALFGVEYVGMGEYCGFEVTGNSRFLLGDYTVTHNTRVGSRYVYRKIIRNPHAFGMICANTYNQLHSATLPPVQAYFLSIGLDFVVDKRPPASWGIPKLLTSYSNVMVTRTGAHIFLRSLDNPDYIRGIEVGWIWIDEISSTTKEAWDIIVGCLRDPRAKQDEKQILVTGTPDGDNWTWREFKKKWSTDPKVNKFFDMVFMSTRENPFVDEDFLESMLANYDRRTALQEVDGRVLVDNEANIYYEYRETYHKRTMSAYRPDKPLILCWDFNASKVAPMSMVICQLHAYRNGVPFVQVIDEIIIPSGNTPKVCEEFIKRYKGHNRGIWVYGDSTGHTRTASVGITDYQMINQYLSPHFPGIRFSVPRQNMPERNRTAAMNAMLVNSHGDIRLFVAPNCTELLTDFAEVVPDMYGRIDKNKDKKRTHASDALGYFIGREFPVNYSGLYKASSEESYARSQYAGGAASDDPFMPKS